MIWSHILFYVKPGNLDIMNKYILVIDDDPVLLAMVADYLKEAGFTVSTADCGI
jgi:hypothetical protein